MAIITNTEISSCKPADKREEKELKVYELLDSLKIKYERLDHLPAATIEDCEEVDKVLGTKMCKNLFLCNAGKTEFHLLLMRGEKKFVTKDFSKKIGSSRLSFASAEYMEKYLNITPGAVSVLGLMNDTEKKVKLHIDSDLLTDEFIGCHPCVNTSSLKIKTTDITDIFLKALDVSFDTVEL